MPRRYIYFKSKERRAEAKIEYIEDDCMITGDDIYDSDLLAIVYADQAWCLMVIKNTQ